ncbi:MGH1-like glycoside hydrolase domain-containing protein [Allomuricauda sp. SCSIO 65647]|uniref:MGH1-like glycoside hydrolase domain-containing protein n=1 Tax=Allomuricauda sp. SCSIO 65647 TaxID=2908843 RepID=UPI001F3D0D08|nr:glycosyl hydrolase family 65 protein [Muricauda sp. SCSIO 65647]UJH67843.1 glycoside hydrolase [Muricauda sp. SCSIO 65647]
MLYLTFWLLFSCNEQRSSVSVLQFDDYVHYFKKFNEDDDELYRQHIPNDSAIAFLKANIPLVDVPDTTIQKTYYFRWWTFRKHLKKTPNGFVITEFLPKVSWSGKYNTINCPAAYHIYEGRWLKNDVYIRDYIDYWLTEADNTRKYSFWAADAMFGFAKVHKDTVYLKKHLDHLISNYQEWERERRDAPDRLFWQNDNMDGMELSAGGRIINDGEEKFSALAARPTINSYMYGDAKAIATMASRLGRDSVANIFDEKAAQLKYLVEHRLWNDSLNFFSQLPREYTENDRPIDIRELIGYTPWYFNLPSDDPKYSLAWYKVLDTAAFYAPYGLTTVERSHPYFKISYEGHECQWNGPSWPFATTQTLKSLSNFLNNYKNNGSLAKDAYYKLLNQYAAAHVITWENGESQMWIDENLNPFTGDWISRTRLKDWGNGNWSDQKGGQERGKDYNHSGFCDLVINDLIGFKPQWDGSIALQPLVPDDWNWFCLDRIQYQGKVLTVLWDRDGSKYNMGKGYQIIYNGKTLYHGDEVAPVKIYE